MATVDFSTYTKVTLTNNGTVDITVQLYRVNLFATIKAGDSLKLAITDSEEAVYYDNLKSDILGVAFA